MCISDYFFAKMYERRLFKIKFSGLFLADLE